MALLAINSNTNGNNVVIAAAATKSLRLRSLSLIPAADVVLSIKQDPGGVIVSGPWTLKAGVPWSRTWVTAPLLLKGQGLNLFLGAAVQIAGDLEYDKLDFVTDVMPAALSEENVQALGVDAGALSRASKDVDAQQSSEDRNVMDAIRRHVESQKNQSENS